MDASGQLLDDAVINALLAKRPRNRPPDATAANDDGERDGVCVVRERAVVGIELLARAGEQEDGVPGHYGARSAGRITAAFPDPANGDVEALAQAQIAQGVADKRRTDRSGFRDVQAVDLANRVTAAGARKHATRHFPAKQVVELQHEIAAGEFEHVDRRRRVRARAPGRSGAAQRLAQTHSVVRSPGSVASA